MTGLDFSPASLDQARHLAAAVGVDLPFHGLGEIVTALLDEGMVLAGLVEHDSVPWNALPGQMTELENGKGRLRDRPERLAHSYTVQARKP
jgi:hypothetical protein